MSTNAIVRAAQEGVFLVDAEERSREFPDTFSVPGHGELNCLKWLDFVKVIFEDPKTKKGERIWCRISKIDTDKKTMEVLVQNELVVFTFIRLHQRLNIEYKNVTDWMLNP